MSMLTRTRRVDSARITVRTSQPTSHAAVFREILTLLLVLLGHGLGQTAIPDTPAGHILRAWLDAFNSGDRAKIEAYVKTFDPEKSVDLLLAVRNESGGFDLLGIESSEPKLIKFRAKEKASSTVVIGSLLVNDGQPPTVKNFALRPIPADAVVENVKLDAVARQHVIDGVDSRLKESYVYLETANKMDEALRDHQKHGDYDAVTDGDAFAAQLTEHLQEVSHDKHLRVIYSPYKLPPDDHGPSAEQKAMERKQLEHSNCGFEKVEILSDNIGYLKFNSDPKLCGPTAIAAMNFLSHVEATIFDLRDNRGGDPKMIALTSTYLFDKPTHLNDLYNREKNETTRMNGERLPQVYGAPLRLRVENQLGYKMVKWIERIEFIESEKTLGKGEGGKNEDDEYFDLLPNI
jgi:retinol-binding protein 3